MFVSKKRDTPLSPGRIAWKKFRSTPSAMVALIWIVFSVFITLTGYLITPDSTPFANNQNIELSAKKPGFEATFLKVKKNTFVAEPSWIRTLIRGRPTKFEEVPVTSYRIEDDVIIVNKHTGYNEIEGMELAFKLADVAYSIDSTRTRGQRVWIYPLEGEPEVVGIEELQQKVEDKHIKNRTYLLGTDRFGRDLLSQIIIGTRVSLSVGFIAISIALVLGVILGSLAGFFRGRTDNFIVWLINVVWSIPTLLLVIAITFALGKGFWQIFIAVGLTMWVDVARVVRGQIISLRENEYVEAARALGLPNMNIITKHILPNITGPIVVISAANFASAILIEAGLSFLGIGVQPPMPSWGNMIRENYGFIILDKAYLAIIPGICIMLLVMSFMLVGNGLRDALDKSPLNY